MKWIWLKLYLSQPFCSFQIWSSCGHTLTHRSSTCTLLLPSQTLSLHSQRSLQGDGSLKGRGRREISKHNTLFIQFNLFVFFFFHMVLFPPPFWFPSNQPTIISVVCWCKQQEKPIQTRHYSANKWWHIAAFWKKKEKKSKSFRKGMFYWVLVLLP